MRRQEESFVSSVVAYLLLFCLGSARGLVGQDGCSPSSCGQLEIRYPFRLKSDPTKCGIPSYELICYGNRTLILDFPPGKYYVNKISYKNNTIQLTDFVLARGRCALPSGSLSPEMIIRDERFQYDLGDYYLGDYYLGDTYVAWFSFLNCRKKIDGNFSSIYGYYRDTYVVPVPCLRQSNTFVYVVNDYSVYSLPPSCGFLSMVPAVYDPLTNLNSQGELFEYLQKGFILSWSISLSQGELSPNYSTLSPVIRDCFLKASGDPKDGIWDNDKGFYRMINHMRGKSVFNRMISVPISFEMNFLTCLHDSIDENHLSFVNFRVAVALAVVLDVALLLLVLAILCRITIAPLIVFAFLAYKFWETLVPMDAVEKFLRNHQALTPTRYAYTDIIAMTSHFKEKLGQGGFGSVYKGELPGGFQLVAVKMLGNSKCNGEEFTNEVSTIGRIHHVNVVRLVGFCSEGSKRALVYEYLPKGSLDKYIFSPDGTNGRPFTWDKLNDIALGVARGIDYLHRGCDMRILHFDIKPHNILLDNCFNPKVSDFGLARLYPKNYSMVSISALRGTIGYIAPEQISRSFGVVSYKSDVYSFGMLLMDMAGGRRIMMDPQAENSSQNYYPSWIYSRLNKREGLEIVDDTVIGEVERKLSIVGLWCIQTKPSDRPSMSRVVEMLEAEVDTLEMPPKPFLSSTTPTFTMESCMETSSTGLSIISEHDSLP